VPGIDLGAFPSDAWSPCPRGLLSGEVAAAASPIPTSTTHHRVIVAPDYRSDPATTPPSGVLRWERSDVQRDRRCFLSSGEGDLFEASRAAVEGSGRDRGGIGEASAALACSPMTPAGKDRGASREASHGSVETMLRLLIQPTTLAVVLSPSSVPSEPAVVDVIESCRCYRLRYPSRRSFACRALRRSTRPSTCGHFFEYCPVGCTTEKSRSFRGAIGECSGPPRSPLRRRFHVNRYEPRRHSTPSARTGDAILRCSGEGSPRRLASAESCTPSTWQRAKSSGRDCSPSAVSSAARWALIMHRRLSAGPPRALYGGASAREAVAREAWGFLQSL
jgi:hypothetical protein